MPQVIEHAKTVGAVVGAITATLTLVGWLNASFMDYLSLHFATVEQVTRIEEKLDKVVGYIDGQPKNIPNEASNAPEPPVEINGKWHQRRKAR